MNSSESQHVQPAVTEMDVSVSDVYYSYMHLETDEVQALKGVSLSLAKGCHVALLGRNGSGKSTLAKLINVLELPGRGTVRVLGRLTSDEQSFWYIRSRCGMVFQNPDNQIVGASVEEDVAFGPENLGIPSPEIRERVDAALQYVGLEKMALWAPGNLSGGQKQKLAISGILAMMPQILILDESTAMLDPLSRNDFLALVERLRREKNITVLHITHDMAEAYYADYVYVLEKGRVALEGKPGEVFFQADKIDMLGLGLPVFVGLVREVASQLNIPVQKKWLSTKESSLRGIRELLKAGISREMIPLSQATPDAPDREADPENVLQVSGLTYSYDSLGGKALENISFSVRKGEIFAVIGHSGSGKTTLISHLNGLIRPQEGEVLLYGDNPDTVYNTRNNKDVKQIRKRVGLLFQYPEYQLFEETVRKDIAFGPTKMGHDKNAVEKLVLEAISLVGLDESFLDRSPFELSGGQKRRVAFAGVIAMDPDILVLDEPAAGLDPTGRQEVFRYILALKEMGKTILLVSHDMDEAARYADRILVLSHGRVSCISSPGELFLSKESIREHGLDLPELVSCLQEFSAEYPDLNASVFDVKKAAAELIRAAACKQSSMIAKREGGPPDA